jgi:tetratricopeptide (TPR) repeat protein
VVPYALTTYNNFFYDSMDEIERGFLHEEASAALEAFFDGNPGTAAVQLAWHYSEAGITDKAVNYLVMAGHQARSAYAHTEAFTTCTMALDILSKSLAGEFSPQWVQNTKAELCTLLGKVQESTGEFEDARHYFEQALELTAGSDHLSRASLKREIATTFERQHQHGAALEMLSQAVGLLTENFDPDNEKEMAELISIRNKQLRIHYWQGNTNKMAELIAEFGDTVVERGTPAQKQKYFSAVAGLENRLNRFAPSGKTIKASNQALAAIQNSDSLVLRADVMFGTGFVHLHAGDHAKAAALITQSLELSRRNGDRTQQARCLAYLTVVHRKAGVLSLVEQYLAETKEICEALDMREYVAVVFANQSWIALKNGDYQDATGLAEEALESWQKHSPRYPFKWLALMQLVDINKNNMNVDDAIKYARVLIEPANAKLIGGVEEALKEAVSGFDKGLVEKAASGLATALKYANRAGYL